MFPIVNREKPIYDREKHQANRILSAATERSRTFRKRNSPAPTIMRNETNPYIIRLMYLRFIYLAD